MYNVNSWEELVQAFDDSSENPKLVFGLTGAGTIALKLKQDKKTLEKNSVL